MAWLVCAGWSADAAGQSEPDEENDAATPAGERQSEAQRQFDAEATLLPSTVDFIFEDVRGAPPHWTENVPDLREPERMHTMRVFVVPYAFSVTATFADPEGIYKQRMHITGERLVVWVGSEAPDDGSPVPLEFYAAGDVRVTFKRERLDGGRLTDEDRALEGNVLRFEQIFFSLTEVRGMASRARVRHRSAGQDDIYFRARELRMQSLHDAVAEDVAISMTPHLLPQLYLYAEQVRFRRRQAVSVIDITRTWVMFRDRTVAPFFDQTVNLRRPEGFIRSATVEESDRFGFALDVDLDLWLLLHDNILGRQWEDTFTGRITGGATYYSERGIATRSQFRWLNNSTDGGASAFYIHDSGDDTAFGRSAGFFPLENRDRLRLRAWHQQEFPLDLRLAAHFSYFSDRNLLVEFFNPEFSRREMQDTYLDLSRYDSLSGIRLFMSYQVNDHVPTVEYKPRVQFFIYPSRLFDLPGFDTPVYLQLRTDVAYVVDRPAAGSGDPRTASTRLDLRPGLMIPIDFGLLGFSQELTMQTSWYGWGLDIADVTLPQRIAFESRTTLYTNIFRTFDVVSETFDLTGLRHIIRPELVYLHRFPVTYLHGMSAETIPQFDEVDVPVGVRDALTFYFTTILEGRRPRRGRLPAILDIVTMRGEMSFYPLPERDNDGEYFGPVIASFDFRPQDWIRFHADVRYDFATGGVSRYGVGGTLHLRDSDRNRTVVALDVGHRVVRDTSSISRLAVRWRPSDAYRVHVAAEYDFESEVIRNADFMLQRLFQEFALTIRVRRDFVRDDTTFFVTFEPRGLLAQ